MNSNCQKYRLNQVAEIFTGYQTRGRLRYLDKGSFPMIQTSDISPLGVVDVESLQRIEPDVNPDRFILHNGDILFQTRGSSHKPYYLANVPESALCTNTFTIIRANEDVILGRYLAWWMKQSEVTEHLSKAMRGGTVPFVSMKAVHNVPVCLPDIDTQKRIAELDALWEHHMVLMQQLNDKYEERMQAYFLKIETELLNDSK